MFFLLLTAIDRGQGLNNAIKDASMVVDALTAVNAGTQTLEEAIGEYEAEMIPRGAQEVALSYQLATTRKNARYEDDVVRLGLKRPVVKM
jgi:2-polyprenyl-6-methoxyphenol hydroxylase-like FAD-dependent oxidoreductase